MSDPARFDEISASEPAPGGDHDARVEQLLLVGLDLYFAGRYEQAIHVWTRVLFLDRGHARARAYIERARSAIAEGHRQSDELLHRGTAAFDRGQVGDARQLLTAAAEQGTARDVALAYLSRLDRLERVAPADAPGVAPANPGKPASPAPPPPRHGARDRRLWWAGAAAVTLTGGLWFAGALSDAISSRAADPVGTTASAPIEPLPIVRPSEVALGRARGLFDTGHAGDAIRLLGTISPADPNRPEADRLLAEIQRALIAAAAAPQPLAGTPR